MREAKVAARRLREAEAQTLRREGESGPDESMARGGEYRVGQKSPPEFIFISFPAIVRRPFTLSALDGGK